MMMMMVNLKVCRYADSEPKKRSVTRYPQKFSETNQPSSNLSGPISDDNNHSFINVHPHLHSNIYARC